jgi:hypothetical protein
MNTTTYPKCTTNLIMRSISRYTVLPNMVISLLWKKKKRLLNRRRKKLHVFVDHEEPVPIEVVDLVLLLTQTPAEVKINYAEDNLSLEPP